MTSSGKFVDLAALSLSGSLVPSVPTQLMIKYDPPKVTLVYHFENKSNDQYYHDMPLDKNFICQSSAEDIVSHLYVTEAYYLNPKQVKRQQLIKLVNMIKDNFSKENSNNNATVPVVDGRKKNFFERKRFVNFDSGLSNQRVSPSPTEPVTVPSASPTEVSPPPKSRRHPLNNRRRFDDL